MKDSGYNPVELIGNIKVLSFLDDSSSERLSFRFILRNSEGRLFPLRYSNENYTMAREVHAFLISDMQIKVLIKGPIQKNKDYYDVVEITRLPAVIQ